jgi:SpoVK/Ycf46/Vps4 family AAA+-type ATPase
LWGFDATLSGGKGLHALFAGPPGTGKTLAAEVVAGALGRRLWRIDLSQMVSKYIGETEKNLARVFSAVDSAEAVLFFDEADALFGKRSEVKDAHDRYANQEISYLLQQMDEFEGVAVLATNLARNLDEGFVRRLQFFVEFPFPDEGLRLRIWQKIFPEAAPRGDDVDVGALARSVRLSGGHIRNIALAAAFAAADDDDIIRMAHLWHAARREYQKTGQAWSPPA